MGPRQPLHTVGDSDRRDLPVGCRALPIGFSGPARSWPRSRACGIASFRASPNGLERTAGRLTATVNTSPLEAYELQRHFTLIRLMVVAVNFAIVGYLAVRIMRK